jgi:predicted nucleic-acid-binding Zn-ribbon protein
MARKVIICQDCGYECFGQLTNVVAMEVMGKRIQQKEFAMIYCDTCGMNRPVLWSAN